MKEIPAVYIPKVMSGSPTGQAAFGELPSGLTSASSVEPSLRVEDSRAASLPIGLNRDAGD